MNLADADSDGLLFRGVNAPRAAEVRFGQVCEQKFGTWETIVRLGGKQQTTSQMLRTGSNHQKIISDRGPSTVVEQGRCKQQKVKWNGGIECTVLYERVSISYA